MTTRHHLRAAAPLLIFGTLILILVVGLRHNLRPSPSKFAQHVGDAAPLTDLPILHGAGAHFMTRSWMGRPYILNFFASWCADCHAEHEEIMTLADSRMPLIGIIYKDVPDKASAYLERVGNPFLAVAQDDSGRTGIDWGLTGIPETFVIDRTGTIRWHHIGALTDAVVTNELMPVWEDVAHVR